MYNFKQNLCEFDFNKNFAQILCIFQKLTFLNMILIDTVFFSRFCYVLFK